MLINKLSLFIVIVINLFVFSQVLAEANKTTNMQENETGTGQIAGKEAPKIAAESGGVKLNGSFIAGSITAAALAALILEAATDDDVVVTSTGTSTTTSSN
ncbi:MAG: hypothetical protein ACKVIX_03610 [Sphingomonadales bacterium]|jgi:hypothetical protein